jgi:hypothetical protein
MWPISWTQPPEVIPANGCVLIVPTQENRVGVEPDKAVALDANVLRTFQEDSAKSLQRSAQSPPLGLDLGSKKVGRLAVNEILYAGSRVEGYTSICGEAP